MSTTNHAELLSEIRTTINKIVDPCSAAAGAPAGLISMGLVRSIDLVDDGDGVHVSIGMCITEPGCMMASLFELTVRRDVAAIPGVSDVDAAVDHGFVWDPSLLQPEYQTKLDEARAAMAERIRPVGAVDVGFPTRPPVAVGTR